jgi:hypothetical protein
MSKPSKKLGQAGLHLDHEDRGDMLLRTVVGLLLLLLLLPIRVAAHLAVVT